MKGKISIIEFVKTGMFGDISLDMTKKEVESIMGEPDGHFDSGDSSLLNYGWWEVHFLRSNANKAYLIHNDHLLYDCTNHDEMIQFENDHWKLELDFIKPFQHIRLRQIIEILDGHNIGYKLVNEDYQPILQLENKVYMDFTDTEPFKTKGEGFSWGPGRNQGLQSGEKRIKKSEDLILYTIGVSA